MNPIKRNTALATFATSTFALTTPALAATDAATSADASMLPVVAAAASAVAVASCASLAVKSRKLKRIEAEYYNFRIKQGFVAGPGAAAPSPAPAAQAPSQAEAIYVGKHSKKAAHPGACAPAAAGPSRKPAPSRIDDALAAIASLGVDDSSVPQAPWEFSSAPAPARVRSKSEILSNLPTMGLPVVAAACMSASPTGSVFGQTMSLTSRIPAIEVPACRSDVTDSISAFSFSSANKTYVAQPRSGFVTVEYGASASAPAAVFPASKAAALMALPVV